MTQFMALINAHATTVYLWGASFPANRRLGTAKFYCGLELTAFDRKY